MNPETRKNLNFAAWASFGFGTFTLLGIDFPLIVLGVSFVIASILLIYIAWRNDDYLTMLLLWLCFLVAVIWAVL